MPTILRKPLLVLLLWGSAVGGSFAQLSANFTNQTACDRSVTFTNNSSGFTTVLWNFGDGNSSTSVSPTHQYLTSGTFTVTLQVSNGALNTSASQTITIYDPPAQSIAGSVSACIHTQETYSVSTSGNNYQWAVAGGTITSGQGTNSIIVQWTQTGTGIITLHERNANGCEATINNTVQVHPLPNPNISIAADQVGTTNIPNGEACVNTVVPYYLQQLDTSSSYFWEVVGGNILSSALSDSVVVFWDVEGSGLLRVTQTSAFGCSATDQVAIQVNPAPVANFSTFDICLGSLANFTDLSTGDFNTWHWEFGDGSTSSVQNPTHVYSSAGTYNVTLTISYSEDSSSFYRTACSDDTTIAINVLQNPGPQISCPGTVCAGDEETYSTPAITGATYTWVVTGGTITGGGGTGDNEITIDWGNGPVGTISLQMSGAAGYCNLPTVIEIPIVSPNPQISGPTTICRYTYTDYSAPLLPGSVYNWTVTGGSITDGQGTDRITTYFSSVGTKTISLDVFHDLTECGGQDVLTAQVLDKFYLSASSSACANSSQTYSVSGSPNTSGYAWNWTITGGIVTAGQGTNSITVQWGNGPIGEVVVDAPAGVYCNAQESMGVSVKPLPPAALLNGALNVCAGSVNTYFVPAGYYTTWTITGGTVTSGGTAGSNYATVQWGTGTTGQVTVQQEDRTSWPYCATTTNFPVSISDNTPISITGATPVCEGFTTTYSAGANSAIPYLWEVNGGNIPSGFGTNTITVQWGAGPWGTVSVSELVCNNTDNLVVQITGTNAALVDTANLTCDGSSLSLFVPGEYAAYNWNTGATDSFITITSAGTYSVSLTDANGCTAEGAITLGAIPTLPVPTAFITGAAPSLSPLVFLELTAHPANHQYQWSTGGTTQRIYVTSAGNYDVTVTNEYGCTATATVVVTVNSTGGLDGGGGSCPGGGGGGGICPLVFPDFTNSICNPIQFTNTTSPAALAYVWEFGDGAYSWSENPVHEYSATGNYTVNLWATDNGVCWSLIQHTVTISSLLEARFGFMQACFGQPVLFTDNSSSALTITSWQWDFGDGNISAAQHPTHTFAAAGTYIVELTISDGVCNSSYQDTVEILDLSADFTYQQACFGNPTLFTDNSTGALQIVRWSWNFGNGSTSIIENPAHEYAAVGTYNVTLTVTDIAGCTASTTIAVDVNQFTAGNITYSGATTFCEGESLVLNAPTGAGYAYWWSTGETTTSITATVGGAYYVIVTNADGCKDTTAPVVITVYPKPSAFITANGPLEFCSNAHFVTLVGNPSGPGFTYQWIKDAALFVTTQTTNVSSVSHSGTYEIIVTDNHGCKDTSAPAVVTIHANPPFPSITPTGPTVFCEGGSVILTAPAGYDYQWSTGATTQSATVSTSGYHTVVVSDSNGCSRSNGIFVTVNPLPDLRLVAYGCYDVCISDSNIIYGPSGMNSYQWSTGETTASILIDAAGTYNLTATSYDGCSNSSSSLNISTTNFLGIDLGNDVSFCEGGTVTFDAGAGFTSYTWHDQSTGQTFTASSSGTYFVEVTDSSGCSGSDTVALTVFPTPFVFLDSADCVSTSVVLDAGSGFNSYLWSDNSTNQTLVVTSSGNYSVTVTDGNNCTAADDTDISFSAATTSLDLGNDISGCEGISVTFDAGAGFTSYTWQDQSTGQTYTADTTGTYTVFVTDSNGCFAMDTVTLTVFPNPVVQLQDTFTCDTTTIFLDAGSGFASYLWDDNSTNQTLSVSTSGNYSVTVTDFNNCTATDAATISFSSSSFVINAEPDTSICEGATVQLSVTGGTTYTWTPNPTLTNPNSSNPTATPTASTTYYVFAVDSFGCSKTDSVVIQILPLLSAQAATDTVLCFGESVQLTASGGTDYVWFPSAGLSCDDCANPVASAQQTTTYGVAVSQSGYCNEDTAYVTLSVLPAPDAGLDSIISIAQGAQITFTPNGGFSNYDWWADNWACEGCPTPTVSPNETTIYTLIVTDSAGCTSTQQVLLRVMNNCEGNFAIPTAFSPNNDGHNDEFRILHQGDLQLIDFKVFNRWGEIVFETEDPNKGWNGIYKGVTQELAVFAYYARMTCGEEVKTLIGNVTLVH